MKRLVLTLLAAAAVFGASHQATACDRIDIDGKWDLIANGYVLEIQIVPSSGNAFNGTVTSPAGAEPSTQVVDGECLDDRRRIMFVRRSAGKFEHSYKAFFWKKNKVTAAAGFYTDLGDTSRKRGF